LNANTSSLRQTLERDFVNEFFMLLSIKGLRQSISNHLVGLVVYDAHKALTSPIPSESAIEARCASSTKAQTQNLPAQYRLCCLRRAL